MTKLQDDYDVCIIGAGIAGALVACKLGLAGTKVVMLETGPRHKVEDRYSYMRRFLKGVNPWQSNNPERDIYTTGGEVEYPLNDYRVKAVGGSTLHWQGYADRLHESDFEMKSRFGIAEDWAIKYSELEPYYCEAEAELGVAGTGDNSFDPPRSKPYPLPGFPTGYDEGIMVQKCGKMGVKFHTLPQARNSISYRGRPACMTYAVCKVCPVRAKYSADFHIELSETTGKVTVIPNANVVRLEVDKSLRVKRAIYMTPDKVAHQSIAKIFVLATGGVESPRLLLLSKSHDFPDGLANSSGMVGKCFMDHTGRYHTGKVDYLLFPFRKGFYTVSTDQFYDKRTRGSEAAFVMYGRAGAPTPPMIAEQLINRSGHWGMDLKRELNNELEEEFGKYFTIGSMVEPIPVETNRVALDDKTMDYFGNPCPKIYYTISDYEKVTFKRADEITMGIFNSMGALKVEWGKLGFGGHHSGTCRMGDDPKKSVVDRNLRAHDVKNLYIAGSSVFVTLGAKNPTLTIAALALRLGDHLLSIKDRV